MLKSWLGYSGSLDDLDIWNTPLATTTQFQSGAFMTTIGEASTGASSAFNYCDDMSFGGYTDWFLPNKTELAYIYCPALYQDLVRWSWSKLVLQMR